MRNNKLSMVLMSIMLFVFLAMGNLLAQTDTNSANYSGPGEQDKTSTSQTNGNSDQQNQGNNGNQGESTFQPTAQQLASDLVTRLNLGQDKTKDISDILVDYRNNIADITKDNSKNSSDQTGMTGNDNSNMTGSNNSDYMKSLQKEDQKTNDKIESAIGKENVAQYMNIKKDWWKDVKDRVYSSVNNESSNMGSDMNNGTTGSGKKGTMNRGTGSGTGTSTDTSGSNRSSY